MKRFLLAAALLAGAFAASAQTASSSAPPAADDSLYQAFGRKEGLVKLMDDFVPRLMADARMQPFFKETNLKNLKEQLVDQLCVVSGGPCKYSGADMKSVHADFDIRKGDFNALVEVLQHAMDAQGIAFSAQNRMLARLAPMHRDIITKP
jgi:hemoglobin